MGRSLEEEEIKEESSENKGKLIMAQGKRCFSGTKLSLSWVLLFSKLLA